MLWNGGALQKSTWFEISIPVQQNGFVQDRQGFLVRDVGRDVEVGQGPKGVGASKKVCNHTVDIGGKGWL